MKTQKNYLAKIKTNSLQLGEILLLDYLVFYVLQLGDAILCEELCESIRKKYGEFS